MMEFIVGIIIIFVISYFIGSSNNSTLNNTISHGTEKEKLEPKKEQKDNVILKPRLNIKNVDLSNIDLSTDQKRIFELVNDENINAYITGKAGTGKSVLLKYFVENTEKNVAVIAPTGVAALNVSGQTIHSFFKLPPELQDLEKITIDYKTKELLRHLDVLVIDEVSMVRADLMEAMNLKLQLSKGNKLPFGGTQVVMFGDLYQLPPVVSDGELHRFFNHNYGGVYFFNAPIFKEFDYQVFELDQIFRQKDKEFIDILNAIRTGNITDKVLEELNLRTKTELPETGFIILAGHNTTVSTINHSKLAELEGKEYIYTAEISENIAEKNFPTEKELKLKVGAQVMILKNDKLKPPRWVNGTLGIITKLTEDLIRVNIDGVEHTIQKEAWDSIRYYYDPEKRKIEKEIVSTFKQFPLRLAWAITIHKSQGQTYQSVAIDLSGRAFASGQTYVALSRCQSLEGLYLLSPIKLEDVIVDQDIIKFMNDIKNE